MSEREEARLRTQALLDETPPEGPPVLGDDDAGGGDDAPHEEKETDGQMIARLLNLEGLDYEREIKKAALAAGVSVAVLRKMVERSKPKVEETGTDDVVESLTPWPGAVDGAELAVIVKGWVDKYAVVAKHVPEVVALWLLATYLHEQFRRFPLLNITAPEKNCGKSVLLDILQSCCRRALEVENISPAAIFRTIEAYHPTLLIDEADTFLKGNEDARGILNSSHKRGGGVVRLVGDDHQPKKFGTYTPIAIAGIGGLHDTLESRCIIIHMERMGPQDEIEPTIDPQDPAAIKLRRRLLAWADQWGGDADEMVCPKKANRRVMDNWNPLFVVAHSIGGDWPELCEAAFREMTASEPSGDSPGVLLLQDLKEIMSEPHAEEKYPSERLVDKLIERKESEWAIYNRGKPLTQKAMAKLLAPYRIKPKQIRLSAGGPQVRGYEVSQFARAFLKYCSYPPEQSVTPSQTAQDGGRSDFTSVTGKNAVTDEKALGASKHGRCDGVTLTQGGYKEDGEAASTETSQKPVYIL